jgi:uncharacterized membrane protein YphA (DoxX/SURF4 family)
MGNNTFTDKGLMGWISILLVFISTYLIGFVEEANSYFILFLILQIAFAAYYSQCFSLSVIAISRIVVGIVFIFSGTVKGIDPVGTEYRIDDYLIAYGADWATVLSLPLSVFLNAVEFVIGILLIFNINMRITAWLVMFIMALFTVVTIYDSLYNPVPDCGCFGDAIILTNWQTLYKNMVLDVMVIIVFFNRNRVNRPFKLLAEWLIFIFFGLFFILFEIYNIRHLPVIDFRNWKVGNKMVNENPLPLKYYLKYQNKETREEQEYLSPNYPYDDSVWMSKWEFVEQRVVDPNPRLHDLYIEDLDGNDVTAQIIENPDLQFILVSYDLVKANTKKMDEISRFIEKCNHNGYSFVILTASFEEVIEIFKNKYELNADFYHADDITLMAMIRANPGLILMRDGVVLGKWHYNDFPDYEQVIGKFQPGTN